MLHADSARNRLTGIGLISGAYLLFSLLDGSAKWLVGSMPVIMVVWLRFALHAVAGGAVLFPLRGWALVKTRHLRWHVVRALMFMAMTGINFWALQYLQLTVTASIFFSVPLMIALAAWESPNGWLEWTVACLLGVLGGVGHYLLALAHRYAPSSVIAPFLYQQVVYMALFGYFVFGDVPSAGVWLGAPIVIASGLYLFARERR